MEVYLRTRTASFERPDSARIQSTYLQLALSPADIIQALMYSRSSRTQIATQQLEYR